MDPGANNAGYIIVGQGVEPATGKITLLLLLVKWRRSQATWEIILTEVGLLWVGAARPLDYNMWSIATSSHTFFNWLLLNQLRQKTSNECIAYHTGKIKLKEKKSKAMHYIYNKGQPN